MRRQFTILAFFAFLFLAGGVCRAEEDDKKFEEATPRKKGGGGGYSQQYHYSSSPSQGEGQGQTYPGISFDLNTGVFLALGAILVLLFLAAVYLPLVSKGGDGWGWGRSSYNDQSLNLAGMSEKVLNAVYKGYEAYNKS